MSLATGINQSGSSLFQMCGSVLRLSFATFFYLSLCISSAQSYIEHRHTCVNLRAVIFTVETENNVTPTPRAPTPRNISTDLHLS